MVPPDVLKLLQIVKLKKLGPLNAPEKFINSKKMWWWMPNFLVANYIFYIQSHSTLKSYIILEAQIHVEIFWEYFSTCIQWSHFMWKWSNLDTKYIILSNTVTIGY